MKSRKMSHKTGGVGGVVVVSVTFHTMLAQMRTNVDEVAALWLLNLKQGARNKEGREEKEEGQEKKTPQQKTTALVEVLMARIPIQDPEPKSKKRKRSSEPDKSAEQSESVEPAEPAEQAKQPAEKRRRVKCTQEERKLLKEVLEGLSKESSERPKLQELTRRMHELLEFHPDLPKRTLEGYRHLVDSLDARPLSVRDFLADAQAQAQLLAAVEIHGKKWTEMSRDQRFGRILLVPPRQLSMLYQKIRPASEEPDDVEEVQVIKEHHCQVQEEPAGALEVKEPHVEVHEEPERAMEVEEAQFEVQEEPADSDATESEESEESEEDEPQEPCPSAQDMA